MIFIEQEGKRMKNKYLKWLTVSVLAAVMALSFGLAGCSTEEEGGGDDESGDTITATEAASMIAAFSGGYTTVSATFAQDASMLIDSDDDSFSAYASYECDVDETTAISIDLTEGDVYYYAVKTDADDTKTEQIVALNEDDGTYYYAETDTAQTALADEDAAVAQISSLLDSITRENMGYIDGDAFVYTGSDWIQAYFLLGTENLTATDSYFTYSYSKTDSDGLTVDLSAKYVGYYGDSGTFDFGTNDDHTGASLTLTTDSDGRILSFSEEMDNYIELNIVSPAVPLSLTGTKTFSASYNGSISRTTLDDVNEEVSDADAATTGTIVVYENENATVTTYDFQLSGYVFTEGTEVEAGHYVAAKVTPADGYEVAVVLVNGVSASLMNGYYCHMTAAEAGTTYTISVTLIEEGGTVSETEGYMTVVKSEYGTVSTYDFNLSSFSGLSSASSTVTAGNYVAVSVSPADNYKVASVTVNGQETTNYNGYYCYMVTAVAGAEYVVEVTYTGYATVTVEDVSNCSYVLYDFDYSTFAFVEGSTVDVGHYVTVSVTPDDGYEVTSVTVDGNSTTYMNGYYVYMSKVTTAGTVYTVTITISAVSE